MFKLRKYVQSTDFQKVRKFIIDKHESSYPLIWTFERWNYAFHFVRPMFDFSISEWEDKIGIWENTEGEIAAVACYEGIGRGEAFFQIDKLYSDDFPYDELFEFAEKNLLFKDENSIKLKLRILEGLEKVENIALERNYSKVPNAYETTTYLSLDNNLLHYDIPSGFLIRSMADDNNLEKRARVFAKAFGNYGTEDEVKSQLYKELQKSSDYKKNLDIYAVNEKNDFVSFCLIWYDEKNKIGILEPVGTDPAYRRKGLAKATVFEAINRVKRLGAEKIIVGDGQQFYRSLGFKESHKTAIWVKEF